MSKARRKKCTICNEPIVLIPSAAERARKDMSSMTASDYTDMFDQHGECTVRKRSAQAIETMRRHREAGEGMRL